MHWALLLTIALRLEPNPPVRGDAATLTIETQGESAPLRVDIGQAAMLRRVPAGATVQRTGAGLELHWATPPQQAACALVLRADDAADGNAPHASTRR